MHRVELAKQKESSLSFSEMNLSRAMRDTLTKIGYHTPTPIQAAAIPAALEARDILGQAQTGTGKTAAFLIPILERLDLERRVPQALVVAPTRELALQILGEAQRLSGTNRTDHVALYGGERLSSQLKSLQGGCRLIVGTPGRILDHLRRGSLRVEHVRHLVLDEVDRMLDIGFRPDIERIIARLPRARQTQMLSATVATGVATLARKYLRDPLTIRISPGQLSCETVEQRYFTTDPERKFELLVRLIARDQPEHCLIFCRTRRKAEQIGRQLGAQMAAVAAIHGNLDQSQRNRVMQRFRAGAIRFLVATDVVGRGIDVTTVSHVINYDIPQDCEDFVHRVGRTGRMGAEGIAYTFATPDEGKELTAIEALINREIRQDRIEGFEAFQKASAAANGNGHRSALLQATRLALGGRGRRRRAGSRPVRLTR